jgi:hypothetical protein
LVASLVAWALSPPDAVTARARGWLARLDGHDTGLRTSKWFELAWDDLFHGAGAMQIDRYARSFPSSGHEIVRTPSEVLREPSANPLEAALLLAALKSAAGLPERLVLVAQAPPGQPAGFILAWRARERWRAVDMSQAALRFAQNERAASDLAARLLADPGLLGGLDDTGVFLDSARMLCALDFRKAKEKYFIRPLPSAPS